MTNRADGRCEQPTTPVSISCTDTEPMPSSVESGAGPLVKGRPWGTKRRADFAIDGDSNASGSKSLQGKAYGAMQTRIKDAKNKKEQARVTREKSKADRPKSLSNTKKRVKKSSASGSQGSVEKNVEKGRALTHLLVQALQAVEHFEESDYPKRSDCTALEPLAAKLAKVYEPCSMLVRQTELMEGLGSTYSQNYDIRPRQNECLEDWFVKVLYRLEYCDLQFQDVEGVMTILETCE